MKKLLLFIAVAVAGKVAFDAFMNRVPSAATVDKNMTRIAAELNQKLPMTQDNFRIERVEYSDRTLRYYGATLQGTEMTDQAKTRMRQNFAAGYCNSGDQILRKYKVAVAYEIRKDGIASISDKVRHDPWSVTVRPEDCVIQSRT